MSNKNNSTILISFLVIMSLDSCSGCSRSGLENYRNQRNKEINSTEDLHSNSIEKVIVKMTRVNGVYQIPIEINDVPMHFIFDTGASIISISETEATFLMKQGTLTNDDIRGTSKFRDATGDISEGTIINLQTVKIGNKVLYNVEASVVHNEVAPLLLGQSALNEFGKISIDYKKLEITLE